MKIRSYSELIRLNSFEERFEYLKIPGNVGIETFGFDRYLNQALYRSKIWKEARRDAFLRDKGCDLAVPGFEVYGPYIMHHMNPIAKEDLAYLTYEELCNPEYLITVTPRTHNGIHYGSLDSVLDPIIERTPNDTCPWRL